MILPARFPNLLVNGSSGIAVGMATNIPPHNLREVAAAVDWALEHPDATQEELLDACLQHIKGPDFPNGALIVGYKGIDDAYRTGRGSVTMRAVVDIEEDAKGRTSLVVTELPYMVNPDNLALKIAELVNTGKMSGIADIRDDSSSRTGQRLVVVLKRDAQPRVVLNNLYKHTQLQDTFGCNMLALVDGVPRTLSVNLFISHWIDHQIEVIQRRTRFRLREAEKNAHIYRGYVKALDALDEVIALIRRSPDVDEARTGLMQLLDIDEIQAQAILDMQLRRLAALERQKIIERLAGARGDHRRPRGHPGQPRAAAAHRQGRARRDRRAGTATSGGPRSSRPTATCPSQDLVPDEDVVVTITRGGYAKRTKTDLYRTQNRGGKGVRGAQLRAEDEISHFFATTNHHWMLFFTTKGRVYRAKVWQLPESARDAKGSHVAGLLSFQPDEEIAQVLTLRDYEQADYLVLATKRGLVKKTALTDYDSARQSGIIAVNFREDDDELIGADLATAEDDLLLVSRKGQSIRFTANDEQLRPMGRATSGVTGMKFRSGDELLSMSVIRAGADEDSQFVFTVTDAGYAKRSRVSEYRQQGRGGLGIKAVKLNDERGSLVGALIVVDEDQVLAIKASGQVVRSRVDSVPVKGRDTMGVRFAGVGESDAVVAIARNTDLTVNGDLIGEESEGVEGGTSLGDAQDVDGSTTESTPESVQNDDERSTDVDGAATVEDDDAGQEG